jgi:hypothetical protein
MVRLHLVFWFVAMLGLHFACTADPVLNVAGLGDCEKITKAGTIPVSPHFWDPVGGKLKLQGGRNEMVAAQLMLTALGGDLMNVNVEIGDLKGPGIIPAKPNLELSQELYQFVEDGSWGWGPPSKMLPSKLWYPEVLVPFQDPYSSGHKPVGAPFDIKTAHGKNQGVWIDLYIPKSAKPGHYQAPIRVTVASKSVFTGTLELTVHPFTLPDETHVDGFGEIYGRAYGFHKAEYKDGFDTWWSIARRYHQMAHQHRFVISERVEAGPSIRNMTDWLKAYTPVLDGSLFTEKEGYHGPGQNTGVSFFKAPFAQAYDSKVPDWTDAQLRDYADSMKNFWDVIVQHQWDKRRWCTYIVDEVQQDARGLANFRKLQDALDAGSDRHVALIWTSHTDPSALISDPATDVRTLVRWWSPNGDACNPTFLAPRAALGDTTWFYHSGHPAVGVHGVNATGIELRTWGVICWRYKISGSFWWAMDLGDAEKPLALPKYKPEDSRWGNGVLFYPGARLSDVGLPNIDGPLSCLRMKAYRRGLQDYEYGWLLQQKGKGKVADDLVKKVMPIALTEATGVIVGAREGDASASGEQHGGVVTTKAPRKFGPPWSENVNDWYQMREDLAAALDR